ncbi:MAG: hypothetical protein MMC33_001440 [Icmadophila ericetorum]|nr:hypothetical protein [Icmadophila ericetorum]
MSMSSMRWFFLAALTNEVLGTSSGSSDAESSVAEAAAALLNAEIIVDDELFATYTLSVFAALLIALAAWRYLFQGIQHVRHLTCLNNDKQLYFRSPHLGLARIKQHLVYAPLFGKQHKEDVQIVSGWSLGVLPTRFQSLLLAGIVAMNLALCCYGIEWGNKDTTLWMKHLRNRSGTLSCVNLVPLVLISGRNNAITWLLGIPFDVCNTLHRWLGRIVTIEAIVHTLAWLILEVNTSGWRAAGEAIRTDSMKITGIIATAAVIAIIFQTTTVLRRAFYETFLHLHIALIIAALVGIWLHLNGNQQQIYLEVVFGLWVGERFIRFLILAYRNFGKSTTKAVVESLPGDAVRVTVTMARPWTFKPGQYMFITIPSIGLWTSHPFSVAWSESGDGYSSEKGLPMDRQDILTSSQKTSMSMIIRRRDGFTNSLHKKVEASPDQRIVISALCEGPYGGDQSLDSYGTIMLFAGGVGITHQVPFVRSLVTGFSNGTIAARRVTLVWIIQSPEHLEWIRPWMTEILALDRRRDILRIQLFVTRPRSTKEIHSPSATVQMFPGRPNVDTLIGIECENQIGAMGVSVCGTGGLSDAVRDAVRRRQGFRNVDFLESTFGW